MAASAHPVAGTAGRTPRSLGEYFAGVGRSDRARNPFAVSPPPHRTQASEGACRAASLGASGVAVRVVDPLEISDWDQRIQPLPGNTFFHGAAWARVLAETYGFKPVYFVTGEAGAIESVLPFMEVNSWLTGRRGVSLPFTDHVAPLVTEPAALHHLTQEATTHGRRRGWRSWECRGGVRPGPEAQPSLQFYRHELDLSPAETDLFARFESGVRRAIRKSERSGVTVETADSATAMDEYFALHCLTRRKHGLPPQPLAFFRNIQRHVMAQGQGRVFLARHQGRVVAGAVFFHANRQAIYKFGASDETSLDCRANNRVMWEAIRWYRDHGCTSLDFGRTSLENAGLRRFKLGWGAAETQAAYFKYDLRQNRFVVERDRVAGWYNGVFRRLPLGVLRPMGAILYPHLA